MSSPKTEDQPARRQPYEKPELKSISLVADQVLGIGCKVNDGPTGIGCLGGCSIQGS